MYLLACRGSQVFSLIAGDKAFCHRRRPPSNTNMPHSVGKMIRDRSPQLTLHVVHKCVFQLGGTIVPRGMVLMCSISSWPRMLTCWAESIFHISIRTMQRIVSHNSMCLLSMICNQAHNPSQVTVLVHFLLLLPSHIGSRCYFAGF